MRLHIYMNSYSLLLNFKFKTVTFDNWKFLTNLKIPFSCNPRRYHNPRYIYPTDLKTYIPKYAHQYLEQLDS